MNARMTSSGPSSPYSLTMSTNSNRDPTSHLSVVTATVPGRITALNAALNSGSLKPSGDGKAVEYAMATSAPASADAAAAMSPPPSFSPAGSSACAAFVLTSCAR